MSTSSFIPSVAFHPGVTLAEKLKEMNMGVKEFALRTTKPEKTIHAVIKGESSITSDMAVAFESVTDIPAHFWMNKQRNYDEYQARSRREAIIAEAIDWTGKFPYTRMVKLGWIDDCKTMPERAKTLMSYFRVSSVKAWEDYYINQKLKISFRLSLANAQDPYALSAWLRQGEIQAGALQTCEYSPTGLKATLVKLKDLMVAQPADFASEAQRLCAHAGVKLLYTPSLYKTSMSGATRWINGSPCIQISGSIRRYDIFWFTLFHELGHIILHGKKDIFIENETCGDVEQQKEEEADRFSANLLLAPEQEYEIITNGVFTQECIDGYARKFNTHPSVIAGRLLHRKIIPSSRVQPLLSHLTLFD